MFVVNNSQSNTQLTTMNILSIITLLTLFLNAINSEEAFLEESYFFTEVKIEFDSYIQLSKDLQKSISLILSPPNSSKSKLSLPTWSKATLHSASHKIKLMQNDFSTLFASFDPSYKPIQKTAKINILPKNQTNILSIANDIKTRQKRYLQKSYAPLEFLGDLECLVTGEPSASRFREVIDFSNKLAAEGKQQGKILHGLASVQHDFQDILSSLTQSNIHQKQTIKNITLALADQQNTSRTEAEITRHILALVSCTDTLILQGQSLHNQIWQVLHAGESGLLSRQSITPDLLTALINKNNHINLSPPQSKNNKYFYTTSLTHVALKSTYISSITRVPLIDPKASYISTKTLFSETLHPLQFSRILTSPSDNGFRYLTSADVQNKCTTNKKTLVCHKRRISIEPHLRGHIFVHDINLMTIFIHQNTSSNVQIICPHTHSNISLPKIANITLHPSCELISFNKFRVWKLEKMPLVSFITPSSNITDLTNDLAYLAHEKTSENNLALINFKNTLDSFKRSFLNDVKLDLKITSHLTSVHKKINTTSRQLHTLDLQQKDLTSDISSHISFHDYIYIGFGAVAFIIILVQIWLASMKLQYQNRAGTTNNFNTSSGHQYVDESQFLPVERRLTNIEALVHEYVPIQINKIEE